MLIRPDITNQIFGRLKVLRRTTNRSKHGEYLWECLCECGQLVIIPSYRLRSGLKRSCGCLIRDEMTKRKARGVKHTSEYRAWVNAKARCNDKGHQAFKDYGGRGITMSSEWQNSFKAFLADMGKKPTPKHTLDRIDNNGPYSKDNCRWVTFTIQHNNRRDNRHLSWNGETHTIAEWARLRGISYIALFQRLQQKWTLERALTTPYRRRASRHRVSA